MTKEHKMSAESLDYGPLIYLVIFTVFFLASSIYSMIWSGILAKMWIDWWQTDVLANREERIDGGFWRASICVHAAGSSLVGLLWTYKAWSYSHCHCEHSGHCNGTHICHPVHHVCTSARQGQYFSSSSILSFRLLSSSIMQFQLIIINCCVFSGKDSDMGGLFGCGVFWFDFSGYPFCNGWRFSHLCDRIRMRRTLHSDVWFTTIDHGKMDTPL